MFWGASSAQSEQKEGFGVVMSDIVCYLIILVMDNHKNINTLA